MRLKLKEIKFEVLLKRRAGLYYQVYKLEVTPRVFTPDQTRLRVFEPRIHLINFLRSKDEVP